MDLGLSGKVALVTGATAGIGRAVAVGLAAEGARVAVTYHSRKEGARETAAQVEARGGEALTAALDLSDQSTIDEAVGQVLDRWGRIDVLVANAVTWDPPSEGGPTLFENVPPDQWQATISAILFGTLRTVQAVIPTMRDQGWGRIAVVSTGIVQRGAVGEVMYGTAKSALHGMTRSLAREVGPAGIYVNVVMPGLTTTEHSAEVFSQDWHEAALSRTPSARLSTAEDVASAILYVCSAANGNITGETIKVDGVCDPAVASRRRAAAGAGGPSGPDRRGHVHRREDFMNAWSGNKAMRGHARPLHVVRGVDTGSVRAPSTSQRLTKQWMHVRAWMAGSPGDRVCDHVPPEIIWPF